MQRLLDILKAVALVVSTLVAASVFVLLLQLSTVARHVDSAIDQIAGDAAASLAGVNSTLESINRGCGVKDAGGQIEPCGVLADVNKTLGTIRGTAGQVEIAANHEDRQLGAMDTQERTLFTDVHGELSDAQKATQALTGTEQAATASLQAANALLAEQQPRVDALTSDADVSLRRINLLLDDPAIAATGKHIDRMTDSGDAILADARTEADKYTHPNKKKLTFWGSVMVGVETLHKIEPPIF